jgi:hypothetical protein
VHLVLSRSARPVIVAFDPQALICGSRDPWEARWIEWERRQEERKREGGA